jgi:hypothetical protein
VTRATPEQVTCLTRAAYLNRSAFAQGGGEPLFMREKRLPGCPRALAGPRLGLLACGVGRRCLCGSDRSGDFVLECCGGVGFDGGERVRLLA